MSDSANVPKDSTASSLALTRAGDVLQLIRTGRASTRADIAAQTGWARSTVAQRLDPLTASGLLHAAGELPSTGGRPPNALQFNAAAGVVLAAEVGATHVRTAVTDLSGRVELDINDDIPATEGPTRILSLIDRRFEELLEQCGRHARDVFGVGIGLASPVEFSTGRPVNPPIMPGWDGFEVAEWMRTRWNAPALVDNEVNMMAIGEHATNWRDEPELLCIKVGTGIGCGIISRGEIHRGAQGAAGDIGHIPVPGFDDVVCRCGNVGCLEAIAGGKAMAQRLNREGIPAATSSDVVELLRGGNRTAIRMVRESGRLIGNVLAGTVNFFNPSVIVVGGDIARAEEHLFAGIREVVYQRSLPLATQHLQLAPSQLMERAAVIGAAITVVEHTLSPLAIDATLARLISSR
jgi:predicted NBD/HSP70 family sugar kinase